MTKEMPPTARTMSSVGTAGAINTAHKRITSNVNEKRSTSPNKIEAVSDHALGICRTLRSPYTEESNFCWLSLGKKS